jgi:two-component system, OmpR family, phosphate regulon sensor histidine kinase PhoR
MKIKSFFWQVLLALVLLCVASVWFYVTIDRAFQDKFSAFFVTLISILLASVFMAYRLNYPLRVLKDHIKKMSEGHITDEVAQLKTQVKDIHEIASSMNTIRDQLQQRIYVITTQKNELDALLSSMIEGVVAVGYDNQILLINRAAEEIFNLPINTSVGRNLHDVVNIAGVIESAEECLVKNEPVLQDIVLGDKKPKYIQIHAAPMHIVDGNRYGAVLVFSDVTRLKELEEMRKEFVTNVSHELRTPLTSIQGFAETLMNPAVKDPEEIKKFLSTIQRHATRLGRIIEDILTLSRIERDAERGQIETKIDFIKTSLETAIELCQFKAEKKNITILLKCPSDLKLEYDAFLIEQAVMNLIDNAIRYSDNGKNIEVSAYKRGSEVRIEIADNGPGIEESQLLRVFERFYRVDKARSRDVGGTGLGLSIVKHIALAHRGRVSVQSVVGQGSSFVIYLPALEA